MDDQALLNVTKPILKECCGSEPISIKSLAKTYHSATFLLITEDGSKVILKTHNLSYLCAAYVLSVQQILNHLEYQNQLINNVRDLTRSPGMKTVFGKTVFEEDGICFSLYDFVEGQEYDVNDLNEKQKLQVIELLSKIHKIPVDSIDPIFLEQKKIYGLNLVRPLENKNKIMNGLSQASLLFKDKETLEILNNKFASLNLKDFFIDQLSGDDIVFAHNDIKPKNILWMSEEIFSLIDWEAVYLFPRTIDVVETVASFSMVKKQDNYDIDTRLYKKLIRCYEAFSGVSLKIQENDILISVLRQLFWMSKCFEGQNYEAAKDAWYKLAALTNSFEELKYG
ncbi:MAG: aminoglycoside phosphotransferase family protein [Candidatus Paracaedibacteraceae bacterium]|nr:aminoglycoside phosphotransferase family protein [Candidatus Paracaedibacteraceae bacterium]